MGGTLGCPSLPGPAPRCCFSPLLVWGALAGQPPTARPPRNTALANLLRCFTCDRLCGGCTAPAPPARPGIVLQPVMPSCEPGPAPACLPAKTFRSYLPRCHRTYSCVHCRAHLAKHDELISKVGGQGEGLAGPSARPARTRARVVGMAHWSLGALCLHSPSKGAMAEPTCLTLCESTSLPRMCPCLCVVCLSVRARTACSGDKQGEASEGSSLGLSCQHLRG